MGRITFVTAFFDIGREQWNQGKFSRSNEKYLYYFKEWAMNFNNDLIVYTDVLELVDEIKIIREHVVAETKVVYIENRHELAPDVYASLKSVNIAKMQAYRLLPCNPEVVNYEYNYVMMLKHVVILRAIQEFSLEGSIGWIDFGISHVTGNEASLYIDPVENDIEKVTLFTGNAQEELDSCVIFDAICKMESMIYGSMFYGPVNLMREFAKECIEAQICLNRIGLMDDDQMMMYIAWRKSPSDYRLIKCIWGDMMRFVRGLPPSQSMKKSNGMRSLLRKIKRRIIKEKNVIRFRKNLCQFDWPQ